MDVKFKKLKGGEQIGKSRPFKYSKTQMSNTNFFFKKGGKNPAKLKICHGEFFHLSNIYIILLLHDILEV